MSSLCSNEALLATLCKSLPELEKQRHVATIHSLVVKRSWFPDSGQFWVALPPYATGLNERAIVLFSFSKRYISSRIMRMVTELFQNNHMDDDDCPTICEVSNDQKCGNRGLFGGRSIE